MSQVSSGARIAPVPNEEWSEEFKEGLRALGASRPAGQPVSPNRPRARNVLGTLANHPELSHAFHLFNGHILYASSISARQKEMLILRVAAVRHAEYEWAQHVWSAREAGMRDDEIERIIEGATADGWSPLEAALLTAVDELIGDAKIGDETWASLAADLTEQQLMDVVFTVGAYELLAMAFRSFEVQMDEDLKSTRPRL